MRAAFCTGTRKLELREVPEPRPADGEVLVEVLSCGICGSDLDWFLGHFPPPAVPPGHEIAGEVVDLGGGDGCLAAGDLVVIEPLVTCGRCPACLVGDDQICREVEVLGVSRPGGFAEYVCVPQQRVYRIPETLDPAVAALAEPAAVCVHGVRLGGVTLGDRVLVLGAGTIGLLSVLAARTAGASEIAVTCKYPHQAEAARRLGATEIFPATPEKDRESASAVRERPPDVVLATLGGGAGLLNEAIHAVRAGGTVVVLGVFLEPPSCDLLSVVMKEVRLVGSITYGRDGWRSDFELALEMLGRNASRVGELVTHRFGLDEIGAAFETAADKTRGAIKIVVTP